MPAVVSGEASPRFDRVAATLAALVVVGLAVFLLVRNEPISDPKLFLVLRVAISLAAAILGATIPGFLDLRWAGRGMAIRAGGALALFVLTFAFTPDVLMDQDLKTRSNITAGPGGIAAGGNISGNNITTTTTIAPPAAAPAAKPP